MNRRVRFVSACTMDGAASATAALARKLRRLSISFSPHFPYGAKRPVSVQVIEAVLSRLEDLEPRLTLQLCSLVEQFSAKPAKIRQFHRAELRWREGARSILSGC